MGNVTTNVFRRRPVVVVALLAALAIFVFRAPLFRATVSAGLYLATGDLAAVDDLSIGSDGLEARGIHLTRGGDPLLDADRLSVAYSLGDLMSGTRRYGLHALTLERPHLWIVRYEDGSLNVRPNGGGTAAPASPSSGSVAPLIADVRISDGSITILDPHRRIVASRRLDLDDVQFAAHLDTGARTTYHGGGDAAGDRTQSFALAGRVDASGYALHRVTAARIAAPQFVNYFINTNSARVLGGTARDLDVRFYSFGDDYHIAGTAVAENASMRVPGMIPSATGLSGPVNFSDRGLATTGMRANLGGIDVKLAGALYDWSKPEYVLGIVGAQAPLHLARGLFHFSHNLPLAGSARIETLLEGAVGTPVVSSRVVAASASYGHYPVSGLSGRAIYYQGGVEVADARATYGGLHLRAGGTIVTGDVTQSDLVASVDGPAARVPYAGQIAPRASLHAIALIAGDDLKLDARGAATGSGGGVHLAGYFHVDPLGNGTFGPLTATRDDGASMAGTFYLNRERSASAFWLDAKRYPFASLAPHAPRLPGVELAPPDFSGTLDGAIAAFGPPSDFRLAGRVHARNLHVVALRIDDVSGNLTGHLGNLKLGNVAGSGPWGRFDGRGAYANTQLALDGTYRGSFDALRSITGDLGAHGPVRGPVALLIDAKHTVVQARNVDARGSRVRNVPVDRFSGTLAYNGKSLHVYSADATVAGGRFTAAGTLASGRALVVSLAGADVSRLHAVAPLEGGGRVATIGTYGMDGKQTRYQGGLAIDGASYAHRSLVAAGDVALEGDRLTFSATNAALGGVVAGGAGTVSGLGASLPRFDVGLTVEPTQVGPLAQSAGIDPRRLNGTAGGALHVTGTRSAYTVRGSLSMPDGSLNGQAFRDASLALELGPQGRAATDGTLTVGSTTARFQASYLGDDAEFAVDVPHARLADFNDLFDGGDTLGGSGHVSGRFSRRDRRVRTQADVTIAQLQYKTFQLGDASARWASNGATVKGTVAFGGTSGRLDAAGTVGLATKAPLEKLLERSTFAGSAHLHGLDLGVWLPALGYQLPVTGRVDADATLTGPLRDPNVRTTAQLSHGTLGRFPVDKLAVVATSTVSRTVLNSLELDLPGVQVAGTGAFGLRPSDPVNVRLHAKSPNVGTLSARALGAALPLEGSLEADLTVDGTRAKPRIAGGFDLENATLRGVAIPRALGQISLRGRDLVLNDVEVGLKTGTLYLAGALPLELAPFGFGPAGAPVDVDFEVRDVDLADFTPLFPSGSQLHGGLSGRVALAGTVATPRIVGSIALAKGAIATPFESFPITDVGATVSFAGNELMLKNLHAVSGGGTVDASGSATFADLVHPGGHAVYRFEMKADRLRLGLPAYGSGQVDGTLALAHVPGNPMQLTGQLALSDAVIPFSALLLASDSSGAFEAFPESAVSSPDADVAFDVGVLAQRNVRVRSANVDIGGRGELHVGGTRSKPELSGGFTSTGGTLAYFNTVFRLTDGKVTFSPDSGVIPNLSAHAVTHVFNPDPNVVRNVSGTADITLDLEGPVTGLSIGLDSDPAYDRQQILGLLLSAPALGATTLFGENGNTTLYGTGSSTLTRDVFPTRSIGSTTVAQEAFGVANQEFTRTLLAPFESVFAESVGLTAFNVNVDLSGNVGLQARKLLGKDLNAIYAATLGYPYRQTVGFELRPNDTTAAQVTVFQTLGTTGGLNSLSPSALASLVANPRIGASQPVNGTIGFSLSLQKFFK